MKFCSRLISVTVLSTFSIITYASDFDDGVNFHLDTLTNQQLNTYRGGFKFNNDYIVNIGLRITTAVNGETIFNSKLANFVIENGALKASHLSKTSEKSVDNDLINVIQVGNNNYATTSTSTAQMQASFKPNAADLSSISNVIQNSVDNSVIGLSTIIDVEAQVGGVIKQIRIDKQIDDAIMSRFY
ncbi:hypothetical protein [Vibrio fluvialis]|uniref:hypothetical protein n=1 Tax=Vibrio fluvialis TaxID=676 RepID=UPI002ACA1D0B|nr:hypothetical protein [Vibrio fluvialis]MDZ5516701.1 hypothetical protein [Vibrio fluvialis]